MEKLREEVGYESLTRKLVRSQLKRAGHVERMKGERLMKRADVLRLEGRRRRGRQILRFGGSGGRGRMRARDGGSRDGWWRRQ